MQLLFVCFEAHGNMDPGSRCIFRLRRELYKKGIVSDVLTYNWSGEKRREYPDAYGTIYLADTWYRHARVVRSPSGKVVMPPQKWAAVALTRVAAKMAGGWDYKSRGFPLVAASRLGKRLRALCDTQNYDVVVSVSYPFVNHEAVLKWCPKNQPVALYNLDPFYANGTYPPRHLDARQAREVTAYQRAQVIFCTPEQLGDYQRAAFDHVRRKIYPLPYPNLEPPKAGESSGILFDPACMNMVYLGTVYADIRRPEALLKLFSAMAEKEPRLRLYIIGNKFGMGAEKYLEEYGQKLEEKLVCHAPILPQQTADVLQNADILVNMGNTVPNQMPSKLIEYIATGKPILNISAVPNCSTIPYVERYPLAFQCFNGQEASADTVDAALLFCREQKGSRLGWATIENLYKEECLNLVAERFLHVLNLGP